MKKKLAIIVLSATLPLLASDAPDLTMQTRIRQEGFRNSKVMDLASGLMDGVGARLTGSPNMKRANEWTRDKLTELGLSNAHLESWGPFGRGWSYQSCTVRMVAPDVSEMWGLPRAWTPGTNGPVRGTPVKIKIEKIEDIDKYKGKIGGKIVLNGDARELKAKEKTDFDRYSDTTLHELSAYQFPAAGGPQRANRE